MSSIARILACAQTQGAKRPTPTQSTCLYYDHDNEASKCVRLRKPSGTLAMFDIVCQTYDICILRY